MELVDPIPAPAVLAEVIAAWNVIILEPSDEY